MFLRHPLFMSMCRRLHVLVFFCFKNEVGKETYHSAITEGPVVNSNTLTLESLGTVGRLAASNNVCDIVALKLGEIEGKGGIRGAIEDEESNALGHGRLDQGQLTAKRHQTGAARRRGETLESSGSRRVDGS